MKKILKIIGYAVCILIITGIVAIAVLLKIKLDKINYESLNYEDIEINEGVAGRLTGYTNIALLGLDAKDDTFENSRSDCIMIISINNETKDVKIVSVYRDTFLDIEGDGLDKVTHAYAYGKAPLALSTLNRNLDLDITKYITINFESVINIIDAIGGVTVEVTSAEATQIPGISTAGTYNLNGTQALAYGRIRKIDNDYARTERMRTVLIALFEETKGMSYSEINQLTDRLLPYVTTNLTRREILSYASKISEYNVLDNYGWPYDVEGITLTAWYGVPVTLETNVKKLHEDLFNEEDYIVSDTVKEISQRIITKTGYSK